MQKIIFHGDNSDFVLLSPDFYFISQWEKENIIKNVKDNLAIDITFTSKENFTKQCAEIKSYKMSSIETMVFKKRGNEMLIHSECINVKEIVLKEIDKIIDKLPKRDKVLMSTDYPHAIINQLSGKNHLIEKAQLIVYGNGYKKGSWNIPNFSDFYFLSYCSEDISDDSLLVMAMF